MLRLGRTNLSICSQTYYLFLIMKRHDSYTKEDFIYVEKNVLENI